MAAPTRVRRWCFDVQSPTLAEHPSTVIPPLVESGRVTWFTGQFERGTANTRLHIQGYIEFKNPIGLAGVRRIYPRAHWTVCNGDAASNEVYCEDETGIGQAGRVGSGHGEEDPLDAAYTAEFGQLPWQFKFGVRPKGQGKRTDIDDMKEDIDAGMSIPEISRVHFRTWTRVHRAVDRYFELNTADRSWLTRLHIVFGEPGTGKTMYVRFTVGDPAKAYWLPPPKTGCSNVWFPNYQGEENVIIDEFELGWIDLVTMKRMIDITPFSVQRKGGDVKFLARDVWIISNMAPEQWWSGQLGAMHRRMHLPENSVTHMVMGPGGLNSPGIPTPYVVPDNRGF